MKEGETDILPKEPCDKRRENAAKCYVPPIPKAYGRGSDEDDASESSSLMNLSRLGKNRQQWRPVTNPFCGCLKRFRTKRYNGTPLAV